MDIKCCIMKKMSLIILLILGITQLSCNNTVEFDLEDAQRQSWIFELIESTDFVDGKHNLNEGILKLYVKTKSFDVYLKDLDSIAQAGGWTIGYSSNFKRVLIKNIPTQTGDENIVVVCVSSIDSNMAQVIIHSTE